MRKLTPTPGVGRFCATLARGRHGDGYCGVRPVVGLNPSPPLSQSPKPSLKERVQLGSRHIGLSD